MEDKPELLHLPKAGSALVVSDARSSLLARARKDATTLLANETSVDSCTPAGDGRDVVSGRVSADEWYRRGQELLRNREEAKAVECFKSGLREDPDHVQLLKCLAFAHYTASWGVVQNYAEAARLLRRAAEQGDPRAHFELGVRHENGLGVAKDFAKALSYYQKGADLGDPAALHELGFRYRNGNGVDKDYAKAFSYYRKCADSGDSAALYELGSMYQQGFGVEKDLSEAARYYRKAAERGSEKAQLQLSWMYKRGLGVPQSDSDAEYWKQQSGFEYDGRPFWII